MLCAAPVAAVTGGDEFPVNSNTPLAQTNAQVASSGSGFVVVWESAAQDGDEIGVFARRFSPDGEPAGTEFVVNEYTTGNQAGPVVAMAGDGDFLVAWRDEEQGSAFSQAFESNGV